MSACALDSKALLQICTGWMVPPVEATSSFCFLDLYHHSIILGNMVQETRRRALDAGHSSRWLSSSSRIYTYGATALLAMASLIMLHAPGVASAAPTKIDMHAGHQLTPDTFQETIRDGIW